MERPYPTAEHIETPRNPFEAIAEEVRIYKEGSDLREALLGLHRIYGKTPLARALQQHTLRSVAVLDRSVSLDIETAKFTMYSGNLLGLYASVNHLPPNVKRGLVNRYFDITPTRYAGQDEELHQLDSMQTYRDHAENLYEIFEFLADERREPVTAAARRVCEPYGREYQPAFVVGVMTPINQVRIFLDEYHAHHSAR